MKRLIIISFLIISIQALFGQMKSEAYFGVSGRTDNAKDILEMYDKGYLISAAFGQSDSFFGWNIKTDINLELLYDKVFEYFPSSIALDAAVCDDHGNVYVTGITIIDDEWPFISKIDSCGNYQWCKILIYEDEYNYGWSNDILLNENNEVVILVTLIDDEQPADQINMTHLIGLSDEGEVLWKKPYASRNDYSWIRQPQGNSIMEINNEYYITGKCYWPYPDDTTHWFLRPLFIGIDSTFEEKWILPFAPLDSVFGRAYKSIPLNDSVFLGAGIRKLPNSLDFSLLMFYTIDGEELGYNEILNEQIGPDINSNEIRNIERINDSLFITTSPFGPDFSENPMGELIIDTAANVFNIKSHPNTVSFIPGLIKTYDNNFVIASNIKESNPAKTDIYVYKIDENLNDVPFDPTPLTYDSLCPG
ncbi:MAG: hypothetical protein JW731_13045, partial [Bacteroidales bacterium]|nr:hypothetical protein [Bacteroidales bacterium]